MKQFAKMVYLTLRQQAKNCTQIVKGKKVNLPSIGSMTLDWDDVSLARKLTTDRTNWTKTAESYQDQFAKWNGSRYTFAFMAGRVALSACLHGLDLKPQDEVIVPGYTCIVVPNALRYAQIKPVFADIELDTYGLDIAEIKKRITPKTKAILLHHLFGLVCRDFDAILDFAKEKGLFVIEDCAHATGCEFRGKKVGNFGDVAFYSSEKSKVFNTVQGGVASTNDLAIANRIEEYYRDAPYPSEEFLFRQLKTLELNYFQNKDHWRWLRLAWKTYALSKHRLISTADEELVGKKPANYGCKMPNAIAQLGINQLGKIDHYNQLRRKNSKVWDNWCKENGYSCPKVIDHSKPVFLRYPVLVEPEKKKNLEWVKRDLQVNPGVWFTTNLHPAVERVPDCPNADKAVKRCINFPTILE